MIRILCTPSSSCAACRYIGVSVCRCVGAESVPKAHSFISNCKSKAMGREVVMLLALKPEFRTTDPLCSSFIRLYIQLSHDKLRVKCGIPTNHTSLDIHPASSRSLHPGPSPSSLHCINYSTSSIQATCDEVAFSSSVVCHDHIFILARRAMPPDQTLASLSRAF